jgi:hypothetical protein
VSARRPTLSRGLAASFAFAVTVALVGLGGSVASADPPALDPDTCANVLDRAQAWPGALDDGTRLVSDGFDSYLSRHQSCQTQM